MRPEHNFRVSPDEWDQTVIREAEYFTTIRPRGGPKYDRREFPTLAAAASDAAGERRVLVYAVAPSGRSTLVPRQQWEQAGEVGPR